MPVVPIIEHGKPGDMFVPGLDELEYMSEREVGKLVDDLYTRKTVAENIESFIEHLDMCPKDRLEEYLKLYKKNAHVSAGACLEALDFIVTAQGERLARAGVSLH